MIVERPEVLDCVEADDLPEVGLPTLRLVVLEKPQRPSVLKIDCVQSAILFYCFAFEAHFPVFT